jgi:hypothetical protein
LAHLFVIYFFVHLRFPDRMNADQVHSYVDSMKSLFSSGNQSVRALSLTALVNFTTQCRRARVEALGARNDIIHLLEDAGMEDPVMNVKYAALINNISNEENCCIRLIEAGALKLVVSLQESFFKPSFQPATSSASSLSTAAHAGKRMSKSEKRAAEEEQLARANAIDGPMGQSLSASIFHNLALKRAVIGPGMLTSMINLMRNTKSLRVLHCVRTLANMSVHPKSRIALAKERRLVPLLSAIMRYGCEEADKVQHYS